MRSGPPVRIDLDPGAFHSAEIPLVFGVPEMGEFDQTAALLSESMLGAWARFAATGDPNGGRLLPWPRFDPVARDVLVFDSESEVRGERVDRCDFWQSLDRGEMPLR